MTTQRTTPPFRADHVGSLLRPAALKEARAKHAQGGITAAQLKDIEDREIEKVIKKQEEIGLKLATDGEFRRSWWHFDFFRGLDGVTFYTTDQGRSHQDHRQARLLRPSHAGALQVSQKPYARHAENDNPGAEHISFPPRSRRDQHGCVPDARSVLRRPRRCLPCGDSCILRCRLPLSAARR